MFLTITFLVAEGELRSWKELRLWNLFKGGQDELVGDELDDGWSNDEIQFSRDGPGTGEVSREASGEIPVALDRSWRDCTLVCVPTDCMMVLEVVAVVEGAEGP